MHPLIIPSLAIALLGAVFARPAAAEAPSSSPRGHVLLSLAQDGDRDLLQFEDLAVGESRQLRSQDGTLVTVIRSVDALTIQSNGKTTRVAMPASSDGTTRIRVVRREKDGREHQRIMVRHGNERRVEVLHFDADGQTGASDTIDVETALAAAHQALEAADLGELGLKLDDLDETVKAALAEARTQGNTKVIVVRKAKADADSTAP